MISQRGKTVKFSEKFLSKGHPLLSIIPRVKMSSYNLRKETCLKPKINTMQFLNMN